jgi:hypothetical protein
MEDYEDLRFKQGTDFMLAEKIRTIDIRRHIRAVYGVDGLREAQ